MEAVELSMFRTVFAGEENPNTHVVYENLNDKINEAIQHYHGRLPVVKSIDTSKTPADQTSIDPNEIVGYVTGITDDLAHCELNVSGVELLKLGVLGNKTIQFCFMAKDRKSCRVDTVVKAALAPILSTKMFQVERSDDICVERVERSCCS